jgi:hypothetical protein
VNIIAFHRRDASDVQRAIDHGSSRTPVQLVGSLLEASDPLRREITGVSDSGSRIRSSRDRASGQRVDPRRDKRNRCR